MAYLLCLCRGKSAELGRPDGRVWHSGSRCRRHHWWHQWRTGCFSDRRERLERCFTRRCSRGIRRWNRRVDWRINPWAIGVACRNRRNRQCSWTDAGHREPLLHWSERRCYCSFCSGRSAWRRGISWRLGNQVCGLDGKSSGTTRRCRPARVGTICCGGTSRQSNRRERSKVWMRQMNPNTRWKVFAALGGGAFALGLYAVWKTWLYFNTSADMTGAAIFGCVALC